MKFKKLKREVKLDIAIKIGDKLVEMGFLPDYTDGDNEFKVMDLICDILKKEKLFIRSKPKNKIRKVNEKILLPTSLIVETIKSDGNVL